MIINIRKLIWRVLGFDYSSLLLKTDFTLLKDDLYTIKGIGSYDNGAKVWRWTKATLLIGNYCSIAYDVNFIIDEGFHKGSTISNYPLINNLNKQNYTDVNIQQRNGIVIGNDVWIGMGAFIMPNVKIGNGAIIAANSVVTRDVPDYAVVVGSPAKVIKYKYSSYQIDKLNKIQWWFWEEEMMNIRKLDFYRLSIEEFIEKYEN